MRSTFARFFHTMPTNLLLLVNLATNHLESRFSVHHRVSGEKLAAVGALKLPIGEVFYDALLVALDQRSFPSLLVPVSAPICEMQSGDKHKSSGTVVGKTSDRC